MWWIIVTAIIALVVVVIVLIGFGGGSSRLFGEVDTKITSLGDCDNDGVANMFDKCPCNAGFTDTVPPNGCPQCTAEELKSCNK